MFFINKIKKVEKLSWWTLVIGSTIGLIASFIQTIERIEYAKNPKIPLTCDINSIFSCSNVFDAWQSAVFGFSNSLMCLTIFALTLGVALAGVSGSKIHRYLRYAMHFFAVFFLGFGAWYLEQSTFSIGYVCVFCLFCYFGVILMNWSWLRINADDLFVSKSSKKNWQNIKKSGADTFAWVLWGIIIGGMITLHFWR